MKKLSHLASLALLATSLVACVSDPTDGERQTDVQQDWRPGGKGDGQTCDFDQMPAKTYYKQFTYSKEDTASGDWYRAGSTAQITATLDNGNEANLLAYFLPENRIIAEYQEYKEIRRGESEVLNQTVIVSRASINESTREISIAGVGVGTPLTVRNGNGCAPAIAFGFASDLRSPGLAGDSAVIQSIQTTAFVIDPDHLEDVPYEQTRRWFEEDVRSGRVKIIRM